MVTQTINVNMIPRGNAARLYCSQGDVGTRVFNFSLYSDTLEYVPEEGSAVMFVGTNAGEKVFSEECAIEGNIATCDCLNTMSAYAGDVTCEISVLGSGGAVSSENFILHVEADPMHGTEHASEDDIQTLIGYAAAVAASSAEAIIEVQGAKQEAQEAKEEAQRATETAQGAVTTAEGAVSIAEEAKEIAAELGVTDFIGATSTTAGRKGLVPAPAAGDEGKILFGSGAWGVLPDPAPTQPFDLAIVDGVYGYRDTDGVFHPFEEATDDSAIVLKVVGGTTRPVAPVSTPVIWVNTTETITGWQISDSITGAMVSKGNVVITYTPSHPAGSGSMKVLDGSNQGMIATLYIIPTSCYIYKDNAFVQCEAYYHMVTWKKFSDAQ